MWEDRVLDTGGIYLGGRFLCLELTTGRQSEATRGGGRGGYVHRRVDVISADFTLPYDGTGAFQYTDTLTLRLVSLPGKEGLGGGVLGA